MRGPPAAQGSQMRQAEPPRESRGSDLDLTGPQLVHLGGLKVFLGGFGLGFKLSVVHTQEAYFATCLRGGACPPPRRFLQHKRGGWNKTARRVDVDLQSSPQVQIEFQDSESCFV